MEDWDGDDMDCVCMVEDSVSDVGEDRAEGIDVEIGTVWHTESLVAEGKDSAGNGFCDTEVHGVVDCDNVDEGDEGSRGVVGVDSNCSGFDGVIECDDGICEDNGEDSATDCPDWEWSVEHMSSVDDEGWGVGGFEEDLSLI